MSKFILRNPILSRGLSSVKEWWLWLTSRERQAVSQFWGCLSIALFGVFAMVTVLYVMGQREAPGASDVLNSEVLLLITSFFLWYFIVIFILSFHPKTRKWADKHFGFRDKTELEDLKVKVKNIETRLESTETALKKLANKGKQKRQ